MHKNELNAAERESFERAMDAVHHMPEEDRYALIEHAVATSIRYATTQKDQVLTDWAQGILATLRASASKAYQAAIADHQPPDLRRPGISAKELLAGLRR